METYSFLSARKLNLFVYLLLPALLFACGGGGGSGNASPTVNAGADFSVDEGVAVEVSATANDSDGDIASYAWVQNSGQTVSLSDSDSARISFDAPEVDQDIALVFTVTVTDDDGSSSSDSVQVDVVANLAPSVDAGADREADEKTAVEIVATLTDSDGTIEEILWEQTSGTTVVLSNATTNTVSFTAPDLSAQETLQFRVTVTDDDGDQSSDVVGVIVIPNVAPAVSVENIEAMEQAEVNLAVAASDSDGTIASYLWEQISGTAVTLSDTSIAAPIFTLPNVDANETLRFRITVTDNDGDASSDELDVSVVTLAYDIRLLDGTLRCNQEAADDVTVTFTDNLGNTEVFPLEYVGVEQNYEFNPTGDLPISVMVESASEQFVGVNAPAGASLNVKVTPENTGCACSNYDVTLNEVVSNPFLGVRELQYAGAIGGDSITWTNIEICEDQLGSVYIFSSVEGKSQKVTIGTESDITVTNLSDVSTTVLTGDGPESQFTAGSGVANFSIDGLVSRTEAGTLEAVTFYTDTDLTDSIAQYLVDTQITDYRADLFFDPDYCDAQISESPSILSFSPSFVSCREFHTWLVPASTMASGLSYSAFNFDDYSLVFESDRIALAAVGGASFDAAVIIARMNSKPITIMMPIVDGNLNYEVLEDVGISSLDTSLTVLPVDYLDVSTYDAAFPLFFRKHQSGLDLGFRFMYSRLQ